MSVILSFFSAFTIKAAMLQCVFQEPGVGVETGSENKHTRVETVGPTGIRSCRQLVSVEELVHVTQNLRGEEAADETSDRCERSAQV